MRVFVGWLQAAHPLPLAVVLCLTALVGVASAGGDLDGPARQDFALLLLGMLLAQLAIGWTNDYVDREQDARLQPWKPVPSGRLDARWLPPAAVAAAGGSLVAGAFLGAATLPFLLLGLGAGLAYDLWLKETRLSPLPFVVALAALPPYVWTALDAYRDSFLGLYLVGTPLALAAHLANVLPDLDSDAAAGRDSLVVRLGRERSLSLLTACLLAPPALLALTLAWQRYEWLLLAPALVVYVLLAAAGLYAFRRSAGRRSDVWGFRLVVLAAVVFAGGWLAAV